MPRSEIVIGLLLVGTGIGLSAAPTAPPNPEPGIWRSQARAAGLPALPVLALTFSPRGTLWIMHGTGGPIQAYDGWSARTLPPAIFPGFPVKESRSGQIWSLHPEGLQEFRRGEWVVHPVSAIRTERDSHPLKVLRSLPILPAERDRVLVALPDAIIKHDVVQGRSMVLRSAQTGGMGRFVDLLETREGYVWVVGEDGAARVPGPVRRITELTPWDVTLIPRESGMKCVGRAFEDEEGQLVVLADAGDGETPVMLLCDGQRWSLPEARGMCGSGPAAPGGLIPARRFTGRSPAPGRKSESRLLPKPSSSMWPWI
jgi:hypothetical protein